MSRIFYFYFRSSNNPNNRFDNISYPKSNSTIVRMNFEHSLITIEVNIFNFKYSQKIEKKKIQQARLSNLLNIYVVRNIDLN